MADGIPGSGCGEKPHQADAGGLRPVKAPEGVRQDICRRESGISLGYRYHIRRK